MDNGQAYIVNGELPELGEEAPLIHSELQWRLPKSGKKASIPKTDKSRRTLGMIGGVSSPIALAMYSTFLFLRAGNCVILYLFWKDLGSVSDKKGDQG